MEAERDKKRIVGVQVIYRTCKACLTKGALANMVRVPGKKHSWVHRECAGKPLRASGLL